MKSKAINEAAKELLRLNLDERDWRAQFRKKVTSSVIFDSVSDIEMMRVARTEIEQGASVRQAAERAAALHGNSATFDAAVQRVRMLLKKQDLRKSQGLRGW